MYAIVRINKFDQGRLREARADVATFLRLHAGQPGYAGSLTVDLGAGRQVVVNLWETQAHAAAGLQRLGPEVGRVLEPLMAASPELIGTGPVEQTDLSLAR